MILAPDLASGCVRSWPAEQPDRRAEALRLDVRRRSQDAPGAIRTPVVAIRGVADAPLENLFEPEWQSSPVNEYS